MPIRSKLVLATTLLVFVQGLVVGTSVAHGSRLDSPCYTPVDAVTASSLGCDGPADTGITLHGHPELDDFAWDPVRSSRRPSDDVQQSDPYAAVVACLAAEAGRKDILGASMAIALDGELLGASGHGLRDRDTRVPVDIDTIFRINSTTKMMTAAAVMQQVERGRLDLHAPVTDYAKTLKVRPPWLASDITLHDLLTHSAAAPDPYFDYELMPHTYWMPNPEFSLGAWASRLSKMHLHAPPGSFWNYGNPNFSLAALAVEEVTGTPYSEYVTTNLWRRAGMTVTTMEPDEVVASGNYATGYSGGRTYTPHAYDRLYARPAGGAYSTPTEVITWTMQLINEGGEILSPASVQAMTAAHVSMQAVPWAIASTYGYGVFGDEYVVADNQSHVVRVLRHPGNGRGYSTELAWVPELGFAFALVINKVTSMHDTVDCALREVAGLVPKPIRSRVQRPGGLDYYTGTYNLVDNMGDSWTAKVSLDPETGGLKTVYPDWGIAPIIAQLAPVSPMEHQFLDTFHHKAYGDTTLTFIEDKRDDVGGDPHARWTQNRFRVGHRVGDLPERLDVEGDQCSELQFTSGHNVSDLRVRAYGLVEPVSMRDATIGQDDPDDPASASVKIDLASRGDLGFFTAWLFEQQDYNLEMYLMQDQDDDGVYSWPGELVERLTMASAQGMLLPARDVRGPYQLWVQGHTVEGREATFSLDAVLVSGDDLRLRGVPASAAAGETLFFDVCPAVDRSVDKESTLTGIVEFDFGAPPGKVRVPVYWTPGQAEDVPALYLPFAWRSDGV